LNGRVKLIEEEFGSRYAEDDLRSALTHDGAMQDLHSLGVSAPSEALYAAVAERWVEAAAPKPTFEGAELAARATSLLRAAGRSMWSEEQYLEALQLVEAER
jgi:hypothetical protein